VDVTVVGISHGFQMTLQHKYGRHITAVTVAAWFLSAILLSEQLQCEMFVLLQLIVQRYKIGSGTSLATRRAPTARSE
jgi:hypothetical protein